jgi:hypothetical protein
LCHPLQGKPHPSRLNRTSMAYYKKKVSTYVYGTTKLCFNALLHLCRTVSTSIHYVRNRFEYPRYEQWCYTHIHHATNQQIISTSYWRHRPARINTHKPFATHCTSYYQTSYLCRQYRTGFRMPSMLWEFSSSATQSSNTRRLGFSYHYATSHQSHPFLQFFFAQFGGAHLQVSSADSAQSRLISNSLGTILP